MPRIRSIFPKQWMDKDYVKCSPLARLLALGIRNHSDDQGVFKWEPVEFKMFILPNDNVDIDELMEELEANNQIKSYEIDDIKYGAVRNFRLYQKPKKPNALYPITKEIGTYTALYKKSSEPNEAEDTTSSENPRQREEGGDNKEEIKGEEEEGAAPQTDNQDEFFDTSVDLDLRPTEAVRLWNEFAEEHGLTKVQRLTKARTIQLKRRLKECGGVKGWKVALEKVAESPGLLGKANGKGHENWQCDFDFLLTESKFTKLMEDKYKTWGKGSSSTGNGFVDLARESVQ